MAVVLAVSAVAVPAVYYALWGSRWGVDLAVYRDGSRAWLAGHDPYGATFTVHHLPYTYPPSALLALAPLAAGPFGLTRIWWWVLSLAATAGAVGIVARRAPASRRPLVGALVVATGIEAVILEPLRSTLDYGQVNAVLMALVVADLLLATRWRGVGVGLAAAVKLTPLVFVVLLVVDRDWPALRRCVVTFGLAVGAAALLAPGPSAHFWLHQALDVSKPGNLAFVGNQSLRGLLARLGAPGGAATAAWVVLSAGVLGAVVVVDRRALRAGAREVALVATALGGLLVSPISWSHHWIWICLVPALALGRADERLGWPRWARRLPWLLVALAVAAPWWWGLRGAPGQVAGDSLVVGGLAVLGGWAWASARGEPRHRRRPGRWRPDRWWGDRDGGGGPGRSGRPGGHLLDGRAQEAELVALGVGVDDPRHVGTLADVDPSGPQGLQPGRLGVERGAVGPQVEVEPVLHRLGVRHGQDVEVR
jgi:alpha-1,2-mannosyltransferase